MDIDSEAATASPVIRPSRSAAAAANRQTSLFSAELSSNVIPFESFQRPGANAPVKTPAVQAPIETPGGVAPVKTAIQRDPEAKPLVSTKPTPRKPANRRIGGQADDQQGSLNLEYLQPAPAAPRTLKTTVEASIYCDAQVAAPMHRSVAVILDAAMVFIGCGIFLGIFLLFGGNVRVDRFDAIMFGTALVLIVMLYGILFAVAGRETAGQNWTELRLINFDGMPPDGMCRVLRFFGSWLSFCACGIGVLWSLLDEENLTWHDHMSKTFLTMREADTTFVRERA